MSQLFIPGRVSGVTNVDALNFSAAPLSAFGDSRVVEVTPQFQSTFVYGPLSDQWLLSTTGSGNTPSSESSMLKCSTSATASSSSVCQSRDFITYKPGFGHLVRFTALFTEGVAGSFQYAGILSDDDGFAFGYDETDFGILHRNSASGSTVNTWIPRASFNVDSISWMDPTKLNVFQLSVQFLGGGEIKFFVENPDSGSFILVHRIRYANSSTYPSLSNPNLRCHFSSVNTTNDSDVVVRSASVGMFTEGKVIRSPAYHGASANNAAIESTLEALMILHVKTTFNSVDTRINSFPRYLSISADGTKPLLVNIYVNPTVSGTPTYSSVTNSPVEYSSTANITYSSGGTFILGTTVSKTGTTSLDLSVSLPGFLLRPDDYLVIFASTPSGTQDVYTSLTWSDDL